MSFATPIFPFNSVDPLLFIEDATWIVDPPAAGVVRYARPISDAGSGAWQPSSGAVLYAMLDETTASDADYIYAISASTCSMTLNGVTDPVSSSGQVINYRARNLGAGSLTVVLKQGATTIASRTNASLTTSYADYQITLTGAECDAITDYSALKIELTSS